MSKSLIRIMVNNILLETRGSLPLYVILKAWIEQLAEHGELASHLQRIPGPGTSEAKKALMTLPKNKSAEVFDNLTSEVQQWVLNHWETKEYFQAMLEGVAVGLVLEYDRSNIGGQKSGTVYRRGRTDDDDDSLSVTSGMHSSRKNKKAVGGWNGYLSVKTANPRLWSRIVPSSTSINKTLWKKEMLVDIDNTFDSTLVHEFQHWFQEGVLYTDGKMKKSLTRKETNTNNKRPNLRPEAKWRMRIAKQLMSGIDWNTKINIRGTTAYKVTDINAFLENDPRLENGYWNPINLIFSRLPKAKAHDFILEDVLGKMFRFKITGEQKANIKENLGDNPLIGSWNLFALLRSELSLDEEEKEIARKITNDGRIYILKNSDFKKSKGVYTEELKPGKEPVHPQRKGAVAKARYIIFTTGTQRLPWKESPGRHMFTQRGNPGEGFSANWNNRWVEMDAEMANFVTAAVRHKMKTTDWQLGYIVRSDAEAYSETMYKYVLNRLKNRRTSTGTGMKAIENRQNQEILRKQTDRIADRLVEVAEEYDYEWWYENKKSAMQPATTPSRFAQWASEGRRIDPPMATREYWIWLGKKAAGENV